MNIQPDVDGIVSADIQRRLLQARQDRWAAEMDRALFATAASTQSGMQASQLSMHASSESTDGAHVSSTHPPAADTAGARQSAASAARSSMATSTSDNASKSMMQARSSGAGPTRMSADPRSAGVELHSSSTASASADAAPLALPSSSPLAAPVAAADAMTLALLAMNTTPQGPANEHADNSLLVGLNEETSEPGTGPEPHEGTAETYTQRLLHIYQDRDQVQAWIRDAGLGPVQIATVAQALVQEVGAQGARLSALTVNGRVVDLDGDMQTARAFHDAVELISDTPVRADQSKREQR